MKALALYKDQSPGVRLHTAIRAWTAPLQAVVAAIPQAGRVLDIGCGHGLISNEVALRDTGSRVLGIDLSESKILAARASIGSRTNIEFRSALLDDIEESNFDAVALVDVLYLVPEAQWQGFLETCFRKLKPGGTFVLKEIGTEPRWKFKRLKLQELVSTRVIRITRGDSFHFESGEQLRSRLSDLGFARVNLQRLDAGYMSPHILLTARRPATEPLP